MGNFCIEQCRTVENMTGKGEYAGNDVRPFPQYFQGLCSQGSWKHVFFFFSV